MSIGIFAATGSGKLSFEKTACTYSVFKRLRTFSSSLAYSNGSYAEHNETVDVLHILRSACDPLAGRWAFERAKVAHDWKRGLADAPRLAKDVSWADASADRDAAARAIAAGFEEVSDLERARRRVALESSLRAYGELRNEVDDLWRQCFGKEALEVVARRIGYSGSVVHETRAAVLWREGAVARPEPVNALRQYMDEIPVLGA